MGLENIAKPAERVCTYFGQMCARTFRATIQASNDHRCRNSDKKKFIKIYSVNQMIKILWKNTCAQTLLYKLQMTSFLQKNVTMEMQSPSCSSEFGKMFDNLQQHETFIWKEQWNQSV